MTLTPTIDPVTAAEEPQAWGLNSERRDGDGAGGDDRD
jgi:hypothetical protein